MFKIKATTTDVKGKIAEALIETKTKENITSVFVYSKEYCIDKECAVRFTIKPDFKIKEYVADSERTTFWRSPYFGTNLAEIPKKSQFVIFKTEDDCFCVVLPVVSRKYKCVIDGGDNSLFYAKMYSGYEDNESISELAFLYAFGKNPFKLIKECVCEALKILGSDTKIIEERKYPEIFEYIGWSSWDSMQIRVSEEGILQKCKEFSEKDVPVKWAILDDMWAEVRNFYGKEYKTFEEMVSLMYASKLDSFEADPKRFPNGLADIISKVNEFGIDVGTWYPTIGYWNGIAPDSSAYRLVSDYLIKTGDGRLIHDWTKNNAYKYFKTINQFLKNAGAEFIKVDRQSICELEYKGKAPIGQIANEYHNAMEKASEEVFSSVMINCMGMASEDMWSRVSSPIARCSDDFKPENKEWFSNHILQCAYNSVLQGQFYYCDWDMWWTDDTQAVKNSLLRAVSGGPIYVSDKIGRTKKEILEPLMFQNGRILRCDRCAMPTFDCLTTDCRKSKKAIKIQNTVGNYGIMSVFNIDENNKPVSTKISGNMIDGFEAEKYAVYEHFSRSFKILSDDESIDVTLKNNDEFKLYIFAPIRNGFAAIGRIDKFVSPATIDYVYEENIVLKEDGPYAYIKDGRLYIADKEESYE